MGEDDKVPKWMQNFITGTYLTSGCACGNGRLCRPFFCVLCSQDHLCHKQFETPGGLHFGHDKIRVRKGSRRYAVTENDLKPYIDTKLVHKYIINDEEMCFLKVKERSEPGSSVSTKDGQLRACIICGDSLKSSAAWGSLCSLECLLRGTSTEGSHDQDNEKGNPPSSTAKPDLQIGPPRKLAPNATPTQEVKLQVDQTPPGSMKRKRPEGAGSSCRQAPPPEATPTATRVEATEVGPSADQGAILPTTSGLRGHRQTNISSSNALQGETSAERSEVQGWLLDATTATLEATVANSNFNKEEVDMLVSDESVNLLLHFFQSYI